MSIQERAARAFDEWYRSLPSYATSGGPARGTIGAALVVLDRLKESCELDLSAHRAPGGSQIQGASGSAVRAILARYGEARVFLSEGGRTNRGAPADIGRLLDSLQRVGLAALAEDERTSVLENLQRYLVERVREFHARERLTFVFDASKSAWQTISEILARAKEAGKEGPVAQYLVGAKLQLRYPEVPVPNFSYSTSDHQQGRPGDFHLEDTAFHVTVSPVGAVFERCRINLNNGLRAYLLVPDRVIAGTRQNAEAIAPGSIFVDSIEAFVGGNVDEMSVFNRKNVVSQFRQLIEIYNSRVDEIESDKSMMIEVPAALTR